MRLLLLLFALTLASGGCSLTGPEGDPRDPLDAMLVRTLDEVPAFGGVRLDRVEPDSVNVFGKRITVYTLGEDPAAEAAIRERVHLPHAYDQSPESAYDVAARPAQGPGTAELAEHMRVLLSSYEGVLDVSLDATTGYVRVSCWTADIALLTSLYTQDQGESLDGLLFQVVER